MCHALCRKSKARATLRRLSSTVLLVSIVSFLLFSSCQKSIFAETESDFVQDSVYLTNSDGLLYVQFLTPGLTTYSGAIICAGDLINPTDTIGHIHPYGSLTLPIQEGTYWEVSLYAKPSLNFEYELSIKWTPFK